MKKNQKIAETVNASIHWWIWKGKSGNLMPEYSSHSAVRYRFGLCTVELVAKKSGIEYHFYTMTGKYLPVIVIFYEKYSLIYFMLFRQNLIHIPLCVCKVLLEVRALVPNIGVDRTILDVHRGFHG